MNDFQTIETWDGLEALAPEWDSLLRRIHDAYLIDSFAWARVSWQHPQDDAARALFCVTTRAEGRLVLIWPFVLRRWHGLQMAQPLATLWGDYSSVPAEDGREAEELVAAALQVLRARCPADLIHLPFVRQNSVLNRILSRSTTPGVVLHTLPAPWICWDGIAAFDDYLRGLSPGPRRDLGRKQRRLAESGTLRFETVTDPDAARPVIDWMLHHKAVWLDRTGKQDTTWIREVRFRQFLYALMDACGPEGRCAIHLLRLDGRVIAADLSAVDAVRIGWYMGTFDAALARHSPGNVLKLFTLRWAFERGLDYDMRLGEGEHKRFWANRVETTLTWRCAASAWGRAYVFGKRAQPMLGEAARLLRLAPGKRAA